MPAMKQLGLLALGALVLTVPALAQAPSRPANPALAADRAQLAACLRERGEEAATSCIGAIAVACVRAASADRRGAESGCARREEAVWRERLTLATQATGRALDAGQRSRLAAVHLAWESYVAQKCALYGAMQGEGLQNGRQAGCELREVAERAIELTRALARQAAPRREPAQPPRIIR